MKNKKFLSVLLCLALLASLPVLPGGAAAAETPDNGMKISKTATANEDGSYTITLEAYATGSQVTTTVQKDIPTDIVLVVDQSGSMDDPIGGYTYTEYRVENYYNSRNYYNNEYYPLRHNGGSENLWHKLDGDKYVAVSVVQESDHQAISGWSNSDYHDNQSNLYCLIDGEYKNVTVEYQWHMFSADEYTYKVSGQQILHTTGSNSTPDFGKYAPLYQSVKKYTYSYTLNGATTVIEESFEDWSSPNTQFYKKDYSSKAGDKRLNALKNAATTFANAVAAKAAGADGNINTTADNVNHRIAVVGYADTDQSYGYNTGVFIGSTLNRYESDAARVYGTALQDMSTTGGKNNVTASINALQASGATRTDYGLIMAKGILDANPVPAGETRNRVVIVFTDGSPTDYNGFQKTVANSAISTANAIKAGETTVYSIGIFSGADASSAGTEPSGDLNNNSSQLTAACNWFMQKVSSNSGTPRTPSYYLSAGDSGSLSSIFQQISNQIQTGGSSTTLNRSTVIKDIISPSFKLEKGTVADITLETYACTGVDANGSRTFATTKNEQSLGERVELTSSENNVDANVPDQVNVTGFDFSDNWCGVENNNGEETPHGNKLVIKIKVITRPGFFGGNGVTTNTSAGIYENENAEKPTFTFDQPKVDVPLATVDVKAPEANVYLGAHLNETVPEANVLKNGATVKIGDSTLDFSQENYGLKPWQNEYVNIEASVSTSGSFENMTEDAGYTVAVKVTPKTPEGAEGKEASATGTIHVFKPELTFRDSEVKYMVDTVTNPEYFIANNKVGDEVWKNGDRMDTSDGVTMLTGKPTLALTYTPNEGTLRAKDGLVISPDDIPVAVAVAINGNDVTQYTTFVHQPCTSGCGWTTPTTHGNPAFLLHVKDVYADLTIKKSGAEGVDEDQSFLFTVTGPDKYSTEVIIVGNGSVTLKNLKIGTYTVTENTSWSWRYTPTNNGQKITLAANGNNKVTINNTRDEDQWLDGNVHADNKFTGAPATTK